MVRKVGVFAFLLLPSLFLWDIKAHQFIATQSVAALPDSPLKTFAQAQRSYLEIHVFDPDKRRDWDPQEKGNHFIEMEKYGVSTADSAKWKRGFDEPSDRGQSESWGRLPWRLEEIYQRLVGEMRTGGWEQARQTMAELCHYASDATVPLHVTENFDGQLTGREGLHRRFEVEFVRPLLPRFESNFKFSVPAKAWNAEERRGAIWKCLRESFVNVPDLLLYDEKSADSSANKEVLRKLREHQEKVALERIEAAVGLTASLWYSAWVEAGSPQPRWEPGPNLSSHTVSVVSIEAARDFIGQEVVVEFVVTKVGRAEKSKVTFLNSSSRSRFTAVIFGEDLQKIEQSLGGTVQSRLEGKKVRVQGSVKLYKGNPEIVVRYPEQIRLAAQFEK